MLRCLLWLIAAAIRPKVLLVADNLCLRPTVGGSPAPQATAAPRGSRPVFLDFGVSVVQRVENLSPHRKARNGAAVAPTGLAHILAPAFTPHREAWPPRNCDRTSDPHPPVDHGEPTYMSTRHVKSPTPLFLFFPSSLSLSFV
jgi:hypothetical protein